MSSPTDYKIENISSQPARQNINNLFEYLLTNGAGRTDISGGGYGGPSSFFTLPNSFTYVVDAGPSTSVSIDHTLYITLEDASAFIPVFTVDQTNERIEFIVGGYKIKQNGTTLDFVNSSGNTVMRLASTGNLSIAGTLTQNATL